MKYSIIDILWCTVAFSLTVFLFIPLPIYLSNREELLTSDSLVISNCLIVSILSTVALTVPLLLAPRKLRKAVLALLVFITLSVWTQANLFNWNYGLFDGSELPWKLIEWRTFIDISVWLLILVGIFYWGVIKEGPYRPVLSLLLFIQLFNLGYAYTHSRTQELAGDRTVRGAHVVPANKFNFSKDKNIIVLILDSYQTDVFLECLDNDEGLRTALNGFSFYPDTLGAYVSTRLTVPLLLTGLFYTNQMPLNQFLSEKHANHSLVEAFKNQGYDIGVYPYWPNTYQYELGLMSTDDDDTLEIRDYTALRQLATLGLFRIVPHVLKNAVFDRFLFDADVSEEDREQFLLEMRRTMRATQTGPCLRWYHLKGLHFPWFLDGQRIRTGSRANALLIAEQLNLLIVEFLDRLKELEVYDNSAILILGDHGNGGVSFSDNALAEDSALIQETECFDGRSSIVTARTIFNWSWERALPMVIMKPFNEAGDLKVDCRQLSLADIYPTVLEIAGLRCDHEIDGVSIFQQSPDAQRLRHFYYYYFDERNNRPGGYFAPLYEYEVHGFCWHKDSYAYTGKKWTAETLEHEPLDKYSYHTLLWFGFAGNGIQYLGENWRGNESGHVLQGGSASLQLLLDPPEQDTSLRLVVQPLPRSTGKSKGLQLRIYAGDTLLWTRAVTRKSTFAINVAKENYKDDRLDLRLELFDPDSAEKFGPDESALLLHALRLSLKE